MTEIVRYIIDLEPGQVETAAGLLNGAGVRFDPTENMIAMPRDNVEEGIFTGGDGECLPERINGYLGGGVSLHRLRRIIQPFHEMSLTARRDFLMLATLHCDWHKNEIQEMDPRAWEIFQDRHPEAVSHTPEA